MILYHHGSITVRLLTDEDATMLVKWLSDSRLLEYYEGRDYPYDVERVKSKFYARTQSITQCIVQYNVEDIGYIQFYPIAEEERDKYGYQDFAGEIYGMDQFIGEVDYWNQGIGTELVKSMVHYIKTDIKADKIVMDPQTWNHRALRVYEKCGFVKKKYMPKHEWHEGEYKDCWLIEYEGQIS